MKAQDTWSVVPGLVCFVYEKRVHGEVSYCLQELVNPGRGSPSGSASPDVNTAEYSKQKLWLPQVSRPLSTQSLSKGSSVRFLK